MENTQISKFGTLADSKEVFSHVLSNSNGVEMHVLNYGCIINKLIIPSRTGAVDVVLGFDTIDDYVNAHSLPAPPYFGAVIGRYSGRIRNGHFKIGNNDFKLNINNRSHTLHGGIKGFDQAVFEVKSIAKSAITLEYISRDGEEHFPGELKLTVTYSITENNEILINYQAISDKDTYVNVTQHSYFNLNGHESNLEEHQLEINADKIIDIDLENIPSGKLVAASEKDFDFRFARAIPMKIDDSFIIDDRQKAAAILESKAANIKLTVTSDQPSLHIYVGGNLFGQLTGKNRAAYHPYSGICFESQNYPDAPNHDNFPNALLRKGEIYNQTTRWTFEF